MRRYLPPPDHFLGKTMSRFPDYEIKELIASGNNGHLFHAYNRRTESSLAFKVVPVENLPRDSSDQEAYLAEAKKANGLENQAVVRYHDVFSHTEQKLGFQCVIFVCDYVKGIDLSTYMKRHSSSIDVVFVEQFLRTMLGLLYELQQRRYSHGDLHARNILVAESEFDIDGRSRFRVTDFGVHYFSGRARHQSDYLFLAEVLRELLLCIDYQSCDGRDRYAYTVLRDDFLHRHLFETDPSADSLARNPRSMVAKLNSISDLYLDQTRVSEGYRLVTPFDYPNCEQIGNSHLLLQSLYSDRLLGLSKIQARLNLVLTGPRGCGKTTVFRALSLEYLTSIRRDNPQDVPYIGVYYRCDDLYFAFPRYKRPDRADALDVPMHYLVATLVATMLEQIAAWSQRHFRDDFTYSERSLTLELRKLFELRTTPLHPSGDTLASLIRTFKDRERKRAVGMRRAMHAGHPPISGLFEPSHMIRACEIVRSRLVFLRDRPIYFFIDDYSEPKITGDLQANLNRLLMCRSADVFFKISTESPVSFARHDVDGKKYVETREFDLLNLGLQHLTDDSHKRREFIEDLFDRRFREVKDYPVRNLSDLLGNDPRNENATARALIADSESGAPGKERPYFAGCGTVAAMCSGDIHYIIRLVSRMVEDYGGVSELANSTSVPRIPFRIQSASIRSAAGEFVDSIRTLPERGPRLASIITAFGNVARSYLLYRTSKNQTADTPHQASRIEPYDELHLSTEAREVLHELLRYSVFIEDPRGKSRRGKVVPHYYLRRYLIPHFLLTFSRRDSIQLRGDQIEDLLLYPARFEKSMRIKSREEIDEDQKELYFDHD